MAILSGQRNRPTPADLLQQKVFASRQAGLGVAFFYLESLWNLGPEAIDQRQAMLAKIFAAPASRLGSGVVSLPPESTRALPPVLPVTPQLFQVAPPPLPPARSWPGALPAIP
jgi:uncharacterized lipoprotein YddW (UPF0748 family)